jgi:hypothetical protein
MADVWVKATFGLEVDQDVDGVSQIFNRIRELTRTQLTGRLALAGTQDVADSITDQAVNVGDIQNIEWIWVESDQEITVKIDGGADNIPIKPLITGENGFLFLMGVDIGALSVSNSSGSAARVTYCFVGQDDAGG